MHSSIEAAPASRFLPYPVYADFVLDSLSEWRREGLRTALLTLVQIDGTSPRPIGSQLAVSEDGRAVGAITGGCAERSLVLDAIQAMLQQTNRFETYGKGSRFKDIELPCGSGIGVHFDVTLSDDDLDSLLQARRRRESTTYMCESPDGLFERIYEPQRRLVIFGHGNVVASLAQMGRAVEYETWVYSPVDWLRRDCAPFARVRPLNSVSDWDRTLLDQQTAFVSLFHDHEYELDLLEAALAAPVFFIGALGSRLAHERRLHTLLERGWTQQAARRIHGPVGLDIGASTPPEIAVSIISQIIEIARL